MTEQERIIFENIAEISKRGLIVVESYRNLIETKLSSCYFQMKCLCDGYDTLLNRSKDYEKYCLEEVPIEDLKNEKNVIACLFQTEKNFQLKDTGMFDEDFVNNLTFEEFDNCYYKMAREYDEVFARLKELDEQFLEISESFNENIAKIKTDFISFVKQNLDVLDFQDVKNIKDYCLESEKIKEFNKNFVDAYNFVFEDQNVYQTE